MVTNNKMCYYEKNKDKLKMKQRGYYHEHKDDPNYSHFLEDRLKKQKDAYSKNKDNVKFYSKKIPLKITQGEYIIIFQ